MPTTNEKFPAPNGIDHPVTTGLLLVCGVTILTALGLTLIGLVRKGGRRGNDGREIAEVEPWQLT